MSASALDHHLASCVDCARWNDEAIRLTRQARLGTVEVPDLTGQILSRAVLPARRVLRRRAWLRAGLLLLAAVQFGVAAPAAFGDGLAMAMSVHAAHETAAWNAAIGVAFVATAVQPRRAGGLLPVLVAFVGVLAVLSVRDVAGAAVTAGRLATHLGVAAGLVLVYALRRLEHSTPPARVTGAGGDGETTTGRMRGVA